MWNRRAIFLSFLALVKFAMVSSETITGTIYADNYFEFYYNGQLVATDPIAVSPHQAVDVSFEGGDLSNSAIYAIFAKDYSDDMGLEWDEKCIGDGGLRALFSDGVFTNADWKCFTLQYGPVNWQECYAASGRPASEQVLPGCRDNGEPLVGCYAREFEEPPGWREHGFDDSHWENAIEFTEEWVDYGVRPEGCIDGASVLWSSPVYGENGNQSVICPEAVDWGDAEFIWRHDIELDNRIICRFERPATTICTPNDGIIVIGSRIGNRLNLSTWQECCAECDALLQYCVAWSYHKNSGGCILMARDMSERPQDGWMSYRKPPMSVFDPDPEVSYGGKDVRDSSAGDVGDFAAVVEL